MRPANPTVGRPPANAAVVFARPAPALTNSRRTLAGYHDLVTEGVPGSSGPAALEFTDVVLEAITGRPARPVRGLRLRMDAAGLTITGPHPESVRIVAWSEMVGARCAPTSAGAHARRAIELVATIGGRQVRWLIPLAQLPVERAAALDHVLRGLTPPLATPEPARSLLTFPGAHRGGAPLHLFAVAPSPPPVIEPSIGLDDARAVISRTAPGGPDDPPSGPPASPSLDVRFDGPPPSWLDPGPGGYPLAPAQRAGAPPSGHRRAAPSTQPLVVALVALVVVLLVGGVVLYVSAGTTSHPRAATGSGGANPAAGDHQVAQQINITQQDLPVDWTVDASSGPLNGFFGSHDAGSLPLSGGQRQAQTRADQKFARCLQVSSSRDGTFLGSTADPSAQAVSPVFEAPGAATTEVASETAVFPSAASVSEDLAEISNPRFSFCFGATIAQLLIQSAKVSGGAAGASIGTPQVQALTLPQLRGTTAEGVSLSVPVVTPTVSVTFELGFFFVGGGRVQSTLITFSAPGIFPVAVSDSLVSTLEKNVAAEGLSRGT